MSKKELDDLQKEIEREIDGSINYSEREKLRESYDHNITKMQRPEKWPDPSENESEDQ
jgi:hypothetical protein